MDGRRLTFGSLLSPVAVQTVETVTSGCASPASQLAASCTAEEDCDKLLASTRHQASSVGDSLEFSRSSVGPKLSNPGSRLSARNPARSLHRVRVKQHVCEAMLSSKKESCRRQWTQRRLPPTVHQVQLGMAQLKSRAARPTRVLQRKDGRKPKACTSAAKESAGKRRQFSEPRRQGGRFVCFIHYYVTMLLCYASCTPARPRCLGHGGKCGQHSAEGECQAVVGSLSIDRETCRHLPALCRAPLGLVRTALGNGQSVGNRLQSASADCSLRGPAEGTA